MKLKHTEFHKERYERAIILFKRLCLLIDLSNWYIPFCFRITCCGNNNRVYNVQLNLLCFSILFCVDEDSF